MSLAHSRGAFHPLRSLRTLWRGVRGYLFGRHGERLIVGWQLLYNLRLRLALRRRRTRRSVGGKTRVRLWSDRRAFRRIEKLLSRAQHTIVIEMFIWKDDAAGERIAAILLACADRGVAVHVTKEAAGDVFESGGDFLGTRERGSGVWKRFWHHPNITVRHAARLSHAKVFVIDGFVLLLTGMNIGDEYRNDWHDYLVEIRGTQLAQYYLTLDGNGVSGPVRLFLSTKRHRVMRPQVTALLKSARTSVVLEQAYLSDPDILQLLAALTRRGVEVLLILPSDPDVHYHANMLAVEQLIRTSERHKLRIFLFPGMVHGKIILVDQERAIIGSTNLVRSSLDEMGEAAVLLDGGPKRAVNKLRRILLRDTLKSRSLTDPPWFPVFRRLLAWFSL